MIIAKKYEVPDQCPPNCMTVQGTACLLCPILMCSGSDPFIHPDKYREDFAKEWSDFFKGELLQLPALKL